VWPVATRPVAACHGHGKPGWARLAKERCDTAWLGKAGEALLAKAWRARARPEQAWRGRQGPA